MNFFRNILNFDHKNPLFFDRLDFWIFFLCLLLLYSLIFRKNRLRNIYLFLISIFFYYKTGGFFFTVLLVSILSNYSLGFAIQRAQKQVWRKIYLALSVATSLGILLFFKYELFLADALNQLLGTNIHAISHATKWHNILHATTFDLDKVIPPVGISFFTFQCLSYAIDVYRKNVEAVKRFTDFGFYVSFFPQLVAGPIVRASHFIPQLYKKYSLSVQDFGLGIYLILKGLTKKILIGDYLAVHLIDNIFDSPTKVDTGFDNLMALYGYSVQVYCDFSGYTDIAIGLALLLGFYLPKNFNSPYKAKSVGEFWKRWHISLSSWLKDYLYIPMGGSRNASYFTYISLTVILLFIVLIAGNLLLIPLFVFLIGAIWLLTRYFPSLKLNITTNINLMITMLLGGLWHGTTWLFLVWGGLNGLGIVVYKFWKKISPYENSTHWLANAWKIFLTFNFITFTRIWFRHKEEGGPAYLLDKIMNDFGWAGIPERLTYFWKEILVMLIALIIHWLPETIKVQYRDWFIARPVYQQVLFSAIVIFIIYQSLSSGLKPFIYFQF